MMNKTQKIEKIMAKAAEYARAHGSSSGEPPYMSASITVAYRLLRAERELEQLKKERP